MPTTSLQVLMFPYLMCSMQHLASLFKILPSQTSKVGVLRLLLQWLKG